MKDFIFSWWGLLVTAVIVVLYLVCDWQGAKARIRSLIFVAEEQARQFALATGKEKMAWVIANGYPFMPAWLKLVISETAFRGIVQYVFDKLVTWAELAKLSKLHD